ncbi:hypothetical protein CIK05_14455 [Bdellovibrio sp. qaytius]|nr:hypothetical protein CIK05_14455 [Bdellovibrio sp. qaytius]
MRHFIFVLLLIHCFSATAFAANLKYINGLYLNKNCEYFTRDLKENWNVVPDDEKNDYLAKIADCSVDRGQLEFAESIINNLDRKNYKSSILNQAKAKLDLSRSDFKRITEDYELKRPKKATFQYYIYVAQSYYEIEDYDTSLKVLSYISPIKLTDYQRNIIRYWKAKNYFIKDEYDKTTYFLDLILDDDDERGWVKDAAQVLKNAVHNKYSPFRAVVYFNTTYDTNTNKESIAKSITVDEKPASYIIDGTYRVNPSLDFYIKKDKTVKKYINVDMSFAWSSKETQNESETYSVKFRNSKKTSARNTFSWDLGLSKSQLEFKDAANDAFARVGLFHLVADDKFATATYRYSRNIEFQYKSTHTLSLSLFKVFDSQLLYGTITQSQTFDHAADYSFDGSTAPIAVYGTVFGNYAITSIDLAHSIDFTDEDTLRTQISYSNTAYQEENLPAGSASLTNSTSKRSDQTYSFSLIYAKKYDDEINLEFFGTSIIGRTHGHQGFITGGTFSHKNYTANQFGINLDWTYE